MAKNKCPACGNEVLDFEETCVECGHPVGAGVGKYLRKKILIPVVGVILVAVFCMAVEHSTESYMGTNIRLTFEREMREHPTFGGVWKEQGAKVHNVTWARVDGGGLLSDFLDRTSRRDYSATVEVSFKGSIHNVEIYAIKKRSGYSRYGSGTTRLTWEVNGDETTAFAFLAETP